MAHHPSELGTLPSEWDIPSEADYNLSQQSQPSQTDSHATPVQPARTLPQQQPQPQPQQAASGAADGQGQAEVQLLWGTDVVAAEASSGLLRFLREFRAAGDAEGAATYVRRLRALREADLFELELDLAHLRAFDARLERHVRLYPLDMLRLLEDAVADVLAAECAPAAAPAVTVRVHGLGQQRHMRQLGPGDVDKLVALRGLVIRLSALQPLLAHAVFVCALCHAPVQQPVERQRVDEPAACNHCHARGSMRLQHNRCHFVDQQQMRVQELPHEVPQGDTPHTVTVVLPHGLVDACKPGDRVELTGIFRAAPVRVSPLRRTVKALFRTYLDAVHIRRVEGAVRRGQAQAQAQDDWAMRLWEADTTGARLEEELPPEKLAALHRLARSPDVYARLTRSLAPSIWELDDVKKGLLCQLFGGAGRAALLQPGAAAGGAHGGFRSEVNVLLVGDPGTSKSQLLQYVNKLAPRGIYTSGKGSSAVGLTAYVTRDPDTRQSVLESGALVLSDRGICCIDEFDKMDDQTRSILHEVMEQQTVSVAKAGIIATLNARTSILASANPRDSRYNAALSVVENIQLPPTLLSRFDLIYLVLDKPDEKTDRRLARHLVSLYYPAAAVPPPSADLVPLELLREYIAYARATVQPQLTADAEQELLQAYVAMRKGGGQHSSAGRKVISATTRQLESLIRLAEAHARIRLSSAVERLDVAEAVRLVRAALHRAAMDPRTGLIDMDLITTGTSASTRQRLMDLAAELRKHLPADPVTPLRVDELHGRVQAQLPPGQQLGQQDLRDALRLLEDEELIFLTADRQTLRKRA